jgi:hypothetical protein
MANVRFTLRGLRRAGAIDRRSELELVRRMKARHFSERTREALREDATLLMGGAASTRLTDRFEREYVDVKRTDAQALLAHLRRPRTSVPAAGAFPATSHWREQFQRQLADVPPLR